jgi:hypothetical protein
MHVFRRVYNRLCVVCGVWCVCVCVCLCVCVCVYVCMYLPSCGSGVVVVYANLCLAWSGPGPLPSWLRRESQVRGEGVTALAYAAINEHFFYLTGTGFSCTTEVLTGLQRLSDDVPAGDSDLPIVCQQKAHTKPPFRVNRPQLDRKATKRSKRNLPTWKIVASNRNSAMNRLPGVYKQPAQRCAAAWVWGLRCTCAPVLILT